MSQTFARTRVLSWIESHYRYIRKVAWILQRYQDGTLPNNADDLSADLVAMFVERFPVWILGRIERDLDKGLAILPMTIYARRLLRSLARQQRRNGTRFHDTRPHLHYHDAMDRAPQVVEMPDCAEVRPSVRSAVDPRDWTLAADTLVALSPDVRAIAALIMIGGTRQQQRAAVGCNWARFNELRAKLAREVSELFPSAEVLKIKQWRSIYNHVNVDPADSREIVFNF